MSIGIYEFLLNMVPDPLYVQFVEPSIQSSSCCGDVTSTDCHPSTLGLESSTYHSSTIGAALSINWYKVDPTVAYGTPTKSAISGTVLGCAYPDVNVIFCVIGDKSSTSSINITLTYILNVPPTSSAFICILILLLLYSLYSYT